jgi:L-histidine N-alpha-methyltransferase
MTALLTPPLLDLHPAPADMAAVVREGMLRSPRQLPAWLLYDAEGSRLFDLICQQPEYSLTRTENALLQANATSIAAALAATAVPAGQAPTLVEFGAGSARKVGPLLAALPGAAYVALDISSEHLAAACARLQQQHPRVPVLGVCCDYSALQQLPDHPLLQRQPRLGFYPGSSLGNFTPDEARTLLLQMAQLLGPEGQLLIGIDQPKSVDRLEAAYNDSAGVSAAFARNLLVRLNQDLGGDFDLHAFSYEAHWQSEHSRIAMALVSRVEQDVQLAGLTWHFAAAEPLITEYSVKYTPQAFARLAASAGWQLQRSWSDGDDPESGDLSLHLLRQADSLQPPSASQP